MVLFMCMTHLVKVILVLSFGDVSEDNCARQEFILEMVTLLKNSTVNMHSHDFSAVNVEVAQVVTKVKKRAGETTEGTIQAINECMTNTTQAAQAKLPNNCALRKLVRRKRNAIQAAPPNPANLGQLILPEFYSMYEVQLGIQENFLLADSEEGPNRILIFGRRSWLQYLQTTTWYADETFSIAPPLFSQVYTILAVIMACIQYFMHYYLTNNEPHTTECSS